MDVMWRHVGALAIAVTAVAFAGTAGTAQNAAAALPPGNAVEQWNKIAENAAVVEAAYRTLVNYFPTQAATLGAQYGEALALIPDGTAKNDGQAVGLAAANQIINLRNGDGRMTPIGLSTSFSTLVQAPGVWRLTPPFALPQTQWVGNVRPFILDSADQVLPDPPPSLQSSEWVTAFNTIKSYGAANSSIRTTAQTD